MADTFDVDTQQTLRNIDFFELVAVMQIKLNVANSIDSWDLDKAYWGLRSLRREVDAKIKEKDKEKEETDNLMKALEETRQHFIGGLIGQEQFYGRIEDVYMEVCRIMKRHGLYFKEGDDPSFAVTRR